MDSPYASIIIASHDRAETLPYSLQSAAQQSVPDIEVLIVGDGCTAEVREVATAFTQHDARFRFLDLPKAPLLGAANRHIAIQSARAERIFYNDDDDLLGAQHVEVLGRALDNADVVDTPVVSVLPSGHVALGIQDSEQPVFRQMLIEETYKGVFDTHLAHRKSAYNNSAGAWLQVPDRRVMLHVLKHFASDARIVWKTEQRVTALSFHAATRLGMPGRKRAAELAGWHAKAANPGLEKEMRHSGSYAFYAFKLFRALQATLGNTGPETMMAELREQIATHLSCRQAQVLRGAVSLLAGNPPGEDAAAQVLDDLLDTRLSPAFPTEDVVAVFLSVFPPEKVDALLNACRPRPSVTLAKFHVDVRRSLLSEEMIDAVTAAMNACPSWERFFFAVSIAQGLQRAKKSDLVWKWSEWLLPTVPDSEHARNFWRLREHAAISTGRPYEAEIASRMVREIKARMYAANALTPPGDETAATINRSA